MFTRKNSRYTCNEMLLNSRRSVDGAEWRHTMLVSKYFILCVQFFDGSVVQKTLQKRVRCTRLKVEYAGNNRIVGGRLNQIGAFCNRLRTQWMQTFIVCTSVFFVEHRIQTIKFCILRRLLLYHFRWSRGKFGNNIQFVRWKNICKILTVAPLLLVG